MVDDDDDVGEASSFVDFKDTSTFVTGGFPPFFFSDLVPVLLLLLLLLMFVVVVVLDVGGLDPLALDFLSSGGELLLSFEFFLLPRVPSLVGRDSSTEQIEDDELVVNESPPELLFAFGVVVVELLLLSLSPPDAVDGCGGRTDAVESPRFISLLPIAAGRVSMVVVHIFGSIMPCEGVK
jgi:hypothetical protein